MKASTIRRRGRRRYTAAALLLTGTLLLTGCGGGATGDGVATAGGAKGAKASAKPQPNKDAQQAMVDFARCMRKHGVNLPDPGGDGVTRLDPADVPPEKMEAAHKACQDKLPKGGAFEGPGGMKIDPKAQERLLKFARCMRQHGIEMPDPSANGGLVVKRGEEGGIDPNSEKFKAAEKACQKYFGPEVAKEGQQ